MQALTSPSAPQVVVFGCLTWCRCSARMGPVQRRQCIWSTFSFVSLTTILCGQGRHPAGGATLSRTSDGVIHSLSRGQACPTPVTQEEKDSWRMMANDVAFCMSFCRLDCSSRTWEGPPDWRAALIRSARLRRQRVKLGRSAGQNMLRDNRS